MGQEENQVVGRAWLTLWITQDQCPHWFLDPPMTWLALLLSSCKQSPPRVLGPSGVPKAAPHQQFWPHLPVLLAPNFSLRPLLFSFLIDESRATDAQHDLSRTSDPQFSSLVLSGVLLLRKDCTPPCFISSRPSISVPFLSLVVTDSPSPLLSFSISGPCRNSGGFPEPLLTLYIYSPHRQEDLCLLS